ncbi:MAG: DUF177 domain-containing protein [Pseudolabrys sp.]|jgi:uncharacterized metal-binding protein YceD (DUF177 family)
MENTQNPWSVPVAVDNIPETGLHIEAKAPAEVRAQLVKLANLRDLPHLSAVFDLTRRGGGVHVAGQVKARVGQTCVVTLEPLENDLDEPINVLFAPRLEVAAKDDGADRRAGDEEPPEPLIEGKVDLGAVATEFLLLGIDPYPRKAGAEFAAVKTADDSARPFAALEALKKRLGG